MFKWSWVRFRSGVRRGEPVRFHSSLRALVPGWYVRTTAPNHDSGLSTNRYRPLPRPREGTAMGIRTCCHPTRRTPSYSSLVVRGVLYLMRCGVDLDLAAGQHLGRQRAERLPETEALSEVEQPQDGLGDLACTRDEGHLLASQPLAFEIHPVGQVQAGSLSRSTVPA